MGAEWQAESSEEAWRARVRWSSGLRRCCESPLLLARAGAGRNGKRKVFEAGRRGGCLPGRLMNLALCVHLSRRRWSTRRRFGNEATQEQTRCLNEGSTTEQEPTSKATDQPRTGTSRCITVCDMQRRQGLKASDGLTTLRLRTPARAVLHALCRPFWFGAIANRRAWDLSNCFLSDCASHPLLLLPAQVPDRSR